MIWRADDPWEEPQTIDTFITKEDILYTSRKLKAAFNLEDSFDLGGICL